MTRPLREQVVVVTGASSGVGRAIARAFGRERSRVGLIARTREALENAAREVRAAGGEAMVLPLDVADPAAVERAADEVAARWGRIDTWVNDAMVSVFSPVRETTPEEYRRVTEVNYLGTVYGTLAALRHMRAAGEGTIVQIGSALAYRSIPLQSAYCASKAAIRGFTDSLRCELAHERSRVRVTMLQLPAVNTPQFDVVRSRLPRQPQPVPPIYQPEPYAEAALFCMEHPIRELPVSWGAQKLLWGQKLSPRAGDLVLLRNGWKGQHTGEPKPIDSPDNLFETLPGDPGAHGRFDDRSRPRTLWTELRLAIPRLLAQGRNQRDRRPRTATMSVTRRASGSRS